MPEFLQQAPSGGFALLMLVVGIVIGWLGRRMLVKKYPDRVAEADQNAKDIGNRLR